MATDATQSHTNDEPGSVARLRRASYTSKCGSGQTLSVRVVDPVGQVEIAERLGVRQQLVYQWKQRGVLPAPKFELAMGPVWEWPTIERWARETGRLTP